MQCHKCGKRKWFDGITIGNVGDRTKDGGTIVSKTYPGGPDGKVSAEVMVGKRKYTLVGDSIAAAVDMDAFNRGLCQCR